MYQDWHGGVMTFLGTRDSGATLLRVSLGRFLTSIWVLKSPLSLVLRGSCRSRAGPKKILVETSKRVIHNALRIFNYPAPNASLSTPQLRTCEGLLNEWGLKVSAVGSVFFTLSLSKWCLRCHEWMNEWMNGCQDLFVNPRGRIIMFWCQSSISLSQRKIVLLEHSVVFADDCIVV